MFRFSGQLQQNFISRIVTDIDFFIQC